MLRTILSRVSLPRHCTAVPLVQPCTAVPLVQPCTAVPLVQPCTAVPLSSVRPASGRVERVRRLMEELEPIIKEPEMPKELRGLEAEKWEPRVLEDALGNKESPQARGRNIIKTLQEPVAIEPQELRFKFRQVKSKLLRLDQKYNEDHLMKLGPDLLACHFMVLKDAKVKLVQEEDWFSIDHNLNVLKAYEPVHEPQVEAIDARNCSLVYEGMDYLRGLTSLKYLNLANCPRIDDHCLHKIAVHCQTLEFLDLSGCPEISERGLAALHPLANLKKLVVHNMEGVTQKQLVCLLLEESIPGLLIEGVEYNKETIDAEIEADLKKREQRYQLSESRDFEDSYLNRFPKFKFYQKVLFKYLPKSNEHGFLARFIGTPGVDDKYSQVRHGL